jgi:2'-5' RNA ligase
MRCFIAIDINEKIRNAIADLQKQLDAKVDIRKGDVKWVEPENIHLTLKFLGEIKDEQADEVCEIAKQVAAGHKNFDIDIESVGTFGGRSAKVVWVGVGTWHGLPARENTAKMAVPHELLALQKDLDEHLAQAGYPPEEREFSAHLTLCRVRNPKAGVKLAEAVKQFEHLKLGSVAADALCVYQSQLTPAGPIYTLLGSFKMS